MLVDGAGDLTVADGAVDRVAVGQAAEPDLDAVARRDLTGDVLDERLLGGVALIGGDDERGPGDLVRRLRLSEEQEPARDDQRDHDHEAGGDPDPLRPLLEFESVIVGRVDFGRGHALTVPLTRAWGVVKRTRASPINWTAATVTTRMTMVASMTP